MDCGSLTHFWQSTSVLLLDIYSPLKRRTFHTGGGMLRRFLCSLDLPTREQTLSVLRSSITDHHLTAVTADIQPDFGALVQARDTPGPAKIWYYHLTHNILLSNPQLLHISTDYKNSAVIPLAKNHSVPNLKPLLAHIRTTRSRISIFGRKLRIFLTWAKDHENSLIVQYSTLVSALIFQQPATLVNIQSTLHQCVKPAVLLSGETCLRCLSTPALFCLKSN